MPSKENIGIGTAYGMIQIPAGFFAWRAFKMHEDMTGMAPQKGAEPGVKHNKGMLAHNEKSSPTSGTFWDWKWINESTVCPFGKFGAATIMAWLIVSTVLMFVLDLKTACFVVGIVSIVMYIVMNALSVWLKRPLAIRAFPFFFFEFGVSILLIMIATLLS